MWNVVRTLTGSGIEEGLRFAYAVSELVPAGLVVGAAAVFAGLLGAAAVRKARAARPPVAARRAQLPWVLGVAVLASGATAVPSDAAVLCRKGTSARLVVRADGCRAREHAVDPRALDVGMGSCVQDIASAWDDLALLRTQLEDARSLAAIIAAHPWDGAETWLALQAALIAQTLTRLDDTARALGVTAARDSIGRMRRAVVEHWSHPVDACSEALAIVPELESALPVPAAG